MPAKRIHPPSNALAEIERLAQQGYSQTGLARFFGVSRQTVKRWLEENERLEEAYEQGIDSYRQSIEEKIIVYTAAGKQCAGLIFLMKSRFKYFDIPSNAAAKVDVNVNHVQPVMIVKDHGTDEDWAKKLAAQQRVLIE